MAWQRIPVPLCRVAAWELVMQLVEGFWPVRVHCRPGDVLAFCVGGRIVCEVVVERCDCLPNGGWLVTWCNEMRERSAVCDERRGQ